METAILLKGVSLDDIAGTFFIAHVTDLDLKVHRPEGY